MHTLPACAGMQFMTSEVELDQLGVASPQRSSTKALHAWEQISGGTAVHFGLIASPAQPGPLPLLLSDSEQPRGR